MDHVVIHPTARINVDHLELGYGSVIGPNCVIEGRDVRIGQEFWMDEGAVIGGGSCFDRLSSFTAGHFLHIGRNAFVNTARPVTIGNEVGLGQGTKLYTHGAYLSALQGFPVTFAPITIGDNVWLPGATVNPGVTIGSNVVVGVGSVVTYHVPSGALAAGVPAKVLRDGEYPRPLDGIDKEEFWTGFLRDYPDPDTELWVGTNTVRTGETIFLLRDRRITGPATNDSELLRHQLRRYGIRFYSRPGINGEYRDWA